VAGRYTTQTNAERRRRRRRPRSILLLPPAPVEVAIMSI
jgi:hypothetical protein